MGITRAQYIQGDNNQAIVLNGQVQGITPDNVTVTISPSGVLSATGAAFLRQIDDISGLFNGTAQNFPITAGGVPFDPGNSDNIIISLGGVLQLPGPAFSIGGPFITFGAAPEPGTTFAGYVIANGPAGGSGGGPGTVTSVGTGIGLSGGPIITTGTIDLDIATTSSLGGVIPDGTTITVDGTGVISAPGTSFLRQVDDISGSFNGIARNFPITAGGVPFVPGNPDNILVSLGGVLQLPGSAFSVTGSTLTFSTPPETGTTFSAYVIVNGPGGGSGGGPGTVTSVGTGIGLSGGPILTTGTIDLDIATTSSLGGVIPDGTTITVDGTGVISAAAPPTTTATIVNLGVVESIDGINTVFTLAYFGTTTPYPLASTTNLTVFLGGVPQLPGISYTVLGNVVTFLSVPPAGTDFIAITVANI